jgi:hypothetical protein
VYTENTDMTHDEINQTVAEYLGIQLYQVVPDPLGEYIEHIDCWGKFLSPDTIMIIQVSTSHSHYAAIEAMATYWANQISYYGTPYNVVRVYTHLQEPYINSIIINKKVLVPITGSAYDANALAAYQAAMPGYEIIGFTGSWENTDALHCRVKEVPDRGMLYIDHKPIGDQSVSLTGYPISATVIPYSGAALVAGYPKLIWKNQTITWTTIQMTLSEDNIYTATIPSQPYGSIVSYYISAADVSGRQEYQPYMGALDPHIFTIEMPSLSYQPTSYNFGTMNAGETDSTTFQIWNGGSGTLSYSLSESSSWLDITPASGSSTGEHDVITVNINTTVLSMGPHVCDISISSNGGSGLVSILVNIIPEEVLDQNQSQYTNNFALYTTRWGGQSFKPTYDLLTRVQLYLRKAGSITTDAVVSIRSSLTGADLVSVVKPASQIPTTNSWVEFDFSDLTVTPGNTYYIILRTTGGTSTNSYSWGYGSGTPYSNGVLWYSSNSGSTWTQYSAYDFCFKTYGLPSMPPVPALSYNPSSYSFGNVASGTTGSTSFDIWNSGTGTLHFG